MPAEIPQQTILDRVTIRCDADGVADVRLARPDKMNALDGPMFDALGRAIDMLGRLPGLRAVVLSGEGPAFCAGLDKGSFAAMLGEGAGAGGTPTHLPERTHGVANLPQHVAVGWRDLPVPVLVAVSGVAFGGGLQIALGGDVRYGAPDCRMSVMEIRWGLVPDMGGMLMLPALVRADVLSDLVFTGRIVEAEEAQAIGLLTHVCADPRSAALQAAHGIAGASPKAIRAAKRLIGASGGDPASVLMAESREQAALIGAPEQREVVRANLEKRKPRFES